MPARILNIVQTTTITASETRELPNYGGNTRFVLTVSAASGTGPTLDIAIEDTAEGAVYFDAATFQQMTAAGATAVDVPPLTKNARLNIAVGGTGSSFDYRLDAVAV